MSGITLTGNELVKNALYDLYSMEGVQKCPSMTLALKWLDQYSSLLRLTSDYATLEWVDSRITSLHGTHRKFYELCQAIMHNKHQISYATRVSILSFCGTISDIIADYSLVKEKFWAINLIKNSKLSLRDVWLKNFSSDCRAEVNNSPYANEFSKRIF